MNTSDSTQPTLPKLGQKVKGITMKGGHKNIAYGYFIGTIIDKNAQVFYLISDDDSSDDVVPGRWFNERMQICENVTPIITLTKTEIAAKLGIDVDNLEISSEDDDEAEETLPY